MKKFSDLNIKTKRAFVGEKISISKVLNKPITVYASKLNDSKFKQGKASTCLTVQIEVDGRKHVLFTGSAILAEQIQQVEEHNYPFETIIVQQGEHYEFT